MDRAGMEAWRGRVLGLLIEFEDRLTSDEGDRVHHLINHGEPAEGLLSLAWVISKRNIDVDEGSRSEIRALAGDLVPDEYWPPGFSERST